MMRNILKCSLCCEKSFENKIALIEHIALVLANIICPICNNKWSSLAHLLEHLNLDNCQPEFKLTLSSPTPTDNEIISEACDDVHNVVKILDSSDVSDGMYLEILNKEKLNDEDHNKELALVSADGDMHQFVIMTTENTEMSIQNVVTKQNSDGTISLEAIKDITLETENDTVIARSDNDAEYNQTEMYSCNNLWITLIMEMELALLEESIAVKGTTKKIITDNGDIVDATVIVMPVEQSTLSVEEHKSVQEDNTIQDKKSSINMLKDVNQEDCNFNRNLGNMINYKDFSIEMSENGLFCTQNMGAISQVLLKNVMVNGERLKTFYCLSCKIHVSDLKNSRTGHVMKF
ncbi:hypothetical protein ACJJTC_000552 [Scirpophaga incertulas]